MSGLPFIDPPDLPRREQDAHKGRSGHVLVVGGSRGLSGAPRLAGAAALTTGAGLVSLLVPGSLRAEVAGNDPALMVQGAPETASGGLSAAGARALGLAAVTRSSVVVGPGLGRHPGSLAAVARLVGEVPRPLVVDADALLVGDVAAGRAGVGPRIYTPHPGEAGTLLGSTAGAVQSDRMAAIAALHGRLGGVVVLKGAGTLVTDGARCLENPTGNPGLAMGGSGDVLAGIIGAFLAQGMDPFDAACAGVWIHGRAADDLLATTGARGMTPGALIAALPAVVASREV
ncbi:MAG: NAD(P)H-hydrate dehydratase [Planctomycetes bacterium]|nr:NAD(P)H-hydrate dehydratase [Planctomycetota bacterium]